MTCSRIRRSGVSPSSPTDPPERIAAQSRGSTWTLGPGPASGPRCPSSRSGTSSRRDDLAHDRVRHHRARMRTPRSRRSARATPTGCPTAVTSLSARSRVSTRLGVSGEADEHDAAGGLDEPRGRRRARRQARRVDHGVEGVRQRRTTRACRCAAPPARAPARSDDSRDAGQVHLDAAGQRELRGEQADRAGAEDQQALTGLEVRRPHRPQAVAGGLDERGGGDADVLGDRVGESRGDQHLLGERTRPAVADADLEPVGADVVARRRRSTRSGRSRASCRP